MSRRAPTWLLIICSVIAMTALLVSTGCGDDDEGEGTEGAGPTATGSSTDGDADEESSDGDDNTGGGAEDAISDLRDLAENYEDLTGVITYRTTGFAGEGFSSMKIYKGEERSRVDYESGEGTGTVITTPDAFYLCGEGACIKYSTGDLSLDPTAGLTDLLSAESISEQYSDIAEDVDVEKSTEEIAGVDATCYAYAGDLDQTQEGDEEGAICVSESGLLLRLEFGGESGGSFEATDATDEVTDEDFEPPYPVTELPSFGR